MTEEKILRINFRLREMGKLVLLAIIFSVILFGTIPIMYNSIMEKTISSKWAWCVGVFDDYKSVTTEVNGKTHIYPIRVWHKVANVHVILLIALFAFSWFIYWKKYRPKYWECPYCNKSMLIFDVWQCDSCNNTQTREKFIYDKCDFCKTRLNTIFCEHCHGEIRVG